MLLLNSASSQIRYSLINLTFREQTDEMCVRVTSNEQLEPRGFVGKIPLVSVGQEAGWGQESEWTIWCGQKSFALAGNRTSIPQSVAIPTELSQLDTQCHGLVVTTDVRFGLVTGFIGRLHLVNNLNSLQFTTARTESSLTAISSPALW
jgi:hypothetical protein